MTAIVSVTKVNENEITVASRLGDAFLNKVIELAGEGYKVIPNSTVNHRLLHKVSMTKEELKQEEVVQVEKDVLTPEPVQEPVQEEKTEEESSEEVADDTPIGYNQTIVDSLGGDKERLEEYGRTLGIELRRNRSFNNMVKDLKKALGVD